ncbi:hypothetical protein NZL82_05760 [Sphingomonas sanguinis]|jgi:hypothetical protein|uniref:hypothetical protein n=1 Tax=Sphingomonas sp. LC-1 TaxID=3110957 RepID=UPI0021BA45D0|nr:hypothetical protein [Sphingomonas sp. LC-1]MCT8001382.1 hypothetical protein [Sphingomonas sp. LC-1]
MVPVPILLILAAPQAHGGHAMPLPRLTPNCASGGCAGTVRPSPYRLSQDHSVPIDSKARAFANDGTYCAVVGDKYCLSKPRTLFRTQID